MVVTPLWCRSPRRAAKSQKQTKKTTMRTEVNMDEAEAVAMFLVRVDGGERCEPDNGSPRRIRKRLFWSFPMASLVSPHQCRVNLNLGDFEGRSTYLPWCRDSGPLTFLWMALWGSSCSGDTHKRLRPRKTTPTFLQWTRAYCRYSLWRH